MKASETQSEGSKALVSSSAGDRASELDPKGMAGVVGDGVREVSRDKRSSLRSSFIFVSLYLNEVSPWGVSYRMLVDVRSRRAGIFQNC